MDSSADGAEAPRGVWARSLAGVVARLDSWRPTPGVLARVWAIAALLLLAPLLPVLTLMHAVFIDEIHIAEYGRLFLDKRESWSIFWQGDHGVTPWYFIGSTFSELMLRATSPSCIGLRLYGMLGTLLASSTLVAWLLRRRTLPAAALLFGLLFLFSPLLMMAYTAGRIDGWMITCGFAAGYQLATFATSPRPWRLFAAGCLVSLGFFVWPTIAFLLPLLGLQLFQSTRASSSSLWRSLVITGTGAALVFLVLGTVVLLRVPSVLTDMPKQLAAGGMTPSSAVGNFFVDARTLFAHLVLRSPWNLPFIFLVWRSGASRAPLALVLLPIAVMFASLMYGNRLIYTVPYLLVAFAGLFVLPDATRARARTPRAAWWLLVASVVAAYAFAAVVRPILPFLHRATRSESLLYSAAESAAAPHTSVCLGGSAVEFYLVGRSRDWRMFMVTPDTLPLCDTVIVRDEEVSSKGFAANLASTGFRRVQTLLPNQVSDTPVWELHVYGSYVYGPYDVYRRE